MAIKPGIKASGQLSTTQQTLYQTTPTQSASVKITLVNTTTSTIKINLWLKDGTATARLISPKDMELQGKHAYTTCYHELGASDSIEGKATVGSQVDYSITGFVKT